jgi:hypothetical protein
MPLKMNFLHEKVIYWAPKVGGTTTILCSSASLCVKLGGICKKAIGCSERSRKVRVRYGFIYSTSAPGFAEGRVTTHKALIIQPGLCSAIDDGKGNLISNFPAAWVGEAISAHSSL